MTPEDWIIERIEEYLDGDLPDDEREEMERRMAADPLCRAEVDEARRFRELAREAGSLRIPDELGERIRDGMAELRSSGGGRRAAARPTVGTRVILLRRLLTAAAAAAIIILIFNPVHLFEPESTPEPDLPETPVARLGEPGTPSPLAAGSLLLDWLDQARNLSPADADRLLQEARELGLLAAVRSRLAGARGSERAFLQAAEDLLIQVENGMSPEALPMEAQLVAMARN